MNKLQKLQRKAERLQVKINRIENSVYDDPPEDIVSWQERQEEISSTEIYGTDYDASPEPDYGSSYPSYEYEDSSYDTNDGYDDDY